MQFVKEYGNDFDFLLFNTHIQHVYDYVYACMHVCKYACIYVIMHNA